MKNWVGMLALWGLLTACQQLETNTTIFSPVSEAQVHLAQGHQLMAGGDFELALRSYTKAAGVGGLTADTLSAMGSANLALGRLKQARKLLDSAVEKDPKFVPAWNNLGVVLMELGEEAEAMRVFRTAFALDNGNSDVIRENLRKAIAKMDQLDYPEPQEEKFELVRWGGGQYLLLETPDSEIEQ